MKGLEVAGGALVAGLGDVGAGGVGGEDGVGPAQQRLGLAWPAAIVEL